VLHHPVARKVMKAEVATNPNWLERFIYSRSARGRPTSAGARFQEELRYKKLKCR
jgi:hypothetical protein